MELFATDYERLAFLLETDAALELDFEALAALAGEESQPEFPPEKRPKYITNHIGSKQKLVDWIWKHTPEGGIAGETPAPQLNIHCAWWDISGWWPGHSCPRSRLEGRQECRPQFFCGGPRQPSYL